MLYKKSFIFSEALSPHIILSPYIKLC